MCSELAGTHFTIRKINSDENSGVQKVWNRINCTIPRNSERISAEFLTDFPTKIACNLPSFSAAAVSCARSAASLKQDCFAVVAEYCLHSSHYFVKYVWSSAHICCAVVFFSHTTLPYLRSYHHCFSASLVAMPQLPSDIWN
jgi:hypothetical protein